MTFGFGRGISVAAAWVLAAATGCSDDGVAAANDGLGGTTGDNAGGSTSSSISTSMTASATNATSGPGDDEGTGRDPSGAPEGSTSGVADTGDSTGGPADESGGTDGDSGEGSTGGSGDSGTGLAPECMVDADCMVVEDCCACGALPAGEMPAVCNQQMCDQSACGEQGIAAPQAQCTFGHCELVPATCNEILVFCATPPPNCPMGTLPSVEQDCWSGECVAVENCDAVPDCTYCDADETCVFTATQLGPSYSCVPTSDECGAVPDCACMGEVCQNPFQCGPGMGAAPLQCFCPVCDGA